MPIQRRTIGLPKELTKVLQEHWKEQAAERTRARQLWKDEGWVFAKRTGEALRPNMDYREWKEILVLLGFVPQVRSAAGFGSLELTRW